MKTIVLFYSRTGNTKFLAGKKAAELGAEIEEIREVKKTGMIAGCYRALKRRKTEIQPIQAELGSYDAIVIMVPIWAGHPVSAIYGILERLPQGKKVELVLVSGGGGSKKSAEGTKACIAERGCELIGYTDIMAQRKNNEVISQPIP